MENLQILINKWQLEAVELSAQVQSGASSLNMSIQLSSKAERLRQCITEAELLLNPQPNTELPPQLNKHDVGSSNPVKKIKVVKLLDKMLNCNMNLYENILDEPGFASHFNELVKLAQK